MAGDDYDNRVNNEEKNLRPPLLSLSLSLSQPTLSPLLSSLFFPRYVELMDENTTTRIQNTPPTGWCIPNAEYIYIYIHTEERLSSF